MALGLFLALLYLIQYRPKFLVTSSPTFRCFDGPTSPLPCPPPPAQQICLVAHLLRPPLKFLFVQRAGVVPEPLFDLNFKSTVWDSCSWTLSRTFPWNTSAVGTGDTTMLVFDGVKMAADVSLNNQVIASIADQFLRVTVPLSNLEASNTLSVTFPPSSDARNSAGRFMACRFAACSTQLPKTL
jgi:hypothetical protein